MKSKQQTAKKTGPTVQTLGKCPRAASFSFPSSSPLSRTPITRTASPAVVCDLPYSLCLNLSDLFFLPYHSGLQYRYSVYHTIPQSRSAQHSKTVNEAARPPSPTLTPSSSHHNFFAQTITLSIPRRSFFGVLTLHLSKLRCCQKWCVSNNSLHYLCQSPHRPFPLLLHSTRSFFPHPASTYRGNIEQVEPELRASHFLACFSSDSGVISEVFPCKQLFNDNLSTIPRHA